MFFSRKNNILNGYVKVFSALLEDNDKNMSEGEKICLRAGGKKSTFVELSNEAPSTVV